MNCEKIDKYDYLIAMATLDAKNDDVEMFENLDTSDVVLSDQVFRKISRLIKTSNRDRNKHITKVQRVLSRVAVIALVVMSMMFTAMMSVSAIRNAVWNVIVEWYDKYISVDYETDAPVSPPTVIEEIRKPTLLPLGFEEEIVGNTKSSYVVEYYTVDDLCLVFRQSLIDTPNKDIDSETLTIKDVMIGAFDGILLIYEKNQVIEILWNDGEYRYTLTGYDIAPETLIMIAESVK